MTVSSCDKSALPWKIERTAMKLPTLKNIVQGALKTGVGATRFRVSREEADRIRKVEETTGHDAATLIVLEILRKKGADQ